MTELIALDSGDGDTEPGDLTTDFGVGGTEVSTTFTYFRNTVADLCTFDLCGMPTYAVVCLNEDGDKEAPDWSAEVAEKIDDAIDNNYEITASSVDADDDGDDGDGQRSGVTASLGAALGPLGGIGTIFNAGCESYFDMTVDASGVWGPDPQTDAIVQISTVPIAPVGRLLDVDTDLTASGHRDQGELARMRHVEAQIRCVGGERQPWVAKWLVGKLDQSRL